MKFYVGIKNGKASVFESEADANSNTHTEYDVVYGPFKSRQDAEGYVNAMGTGLACGEG